MRDLVFTLRKADGDVWMRVYVDKLKLGATDDDGMPLDESYCEYFLIHMENLMGDIPRAEWVVQDIIKIY